MFCGGVANVELRDKRALACHLTSPQLPNMPVILTKPTAVKKKKEKKDLPSQFSYTQTTGGNLSILLDLQPIFHVVATRWYLSTLLCNVFFFFIGTLWVTLVKNISFRATSQEH